jgi:segregation and condensation protein B
MSDWEQDDAADDGDEALPRQHALSLLVPEVKQVVEGALLAAGEPVSLERLQGLYDDGERPDREQMLAALEALRADYRERAIELVEVASGWRVQVRAAVAPWVGRLWQEKPTRYSRALLETLALIAYRQPITRGEIEQIRGVAVSTPIIKTLTEREWVRVVGHRDVPGRPALYATTRRFLDYFNLSSLNELPPLAEVRDASFFEQALAEGEVLEEAPEVSGSTDSSPARGGASGGSSDAAPGRRSVGEESHDGEGRVGPPQGARAGQPGWRPHLVLAASNGETALNRGEVERRTEASSDHHPETPGEPE